MNPKLTFVQIWTCLCVKTSSSWTKTCWKHSMYQTEWTYRAKSWHWYDIICVNLGQIWCMCCDRGCANFYHKANISFNGVFSWPTLTDNNMFSTCFQWSHFAVVTASQSLKPLHNVLVGVPDMFSWPTEHRSTCGNKEKEVKKLITLLDSIQFQLIGWGLCVTFCHTALMEWLAQVVWNHRHSFLHTWSSCFTFFCCIGNIWAGWAGRISASVQPHPRSISCYNLWHLNQQI